MTAAEITSLPMTVEDETRLTELEKLVEVGVEVFVAVGTALAEIRDAKLYRQTHSTFAGYLADRWDISESRGYQLIGAARVSQLWRKPGYRR